MNVIEKHLASILCRNWWLLLLRGLAAIAFGVITWLLPEISLAALVLLFGAYALADGIVAIWMAISGRGEHEHWWLVLLWGFVGIGVGILTLLAPGVTALALLFYIAVWAIATGVLEIVAAIRLRREVQGEWVMVLAGIASVIFGALLMANPGAGALALLWLIATYAIIFGVLLVILSLKARGMLSQATRS
jgi:uncharacterized membrane protein HdeD (DUF308 family)